jgi:methylamine---glutamate N-methyltransferase subunit B
MAEILCDGKTTREINAAIKKLIAEGETEIVVRNPGARHNLAVAITQPVRITFDGSVGYYCAGMIDGPTVEVTGSVGWGAGESMMNGTLLVHGAAGNGVGASIRGGTVVVDDDAAARAGVSMKGGLVLIGGDCGYMAGFMAQKGTLIVCGDAGESFADSMYEAVCYVGGSIAELGNDAVIKELTEADTSFLASTLSRYLGAKIRNPQSEAGRFKKVVAGRKLWNFDKREWKTWREAL